MSAHQKVEWAYGGGAADRNAPLVVLIHGAGMDHTIWRYQTRYLAHHGRRVLALDLPGHGHTPGPALRSVEEMAIWTAARLGGEEQAAAIVGHSLGGLIALDLVAAEPQLVTSVTLLGCAAPMAVTAALEKAASEQKPEAIAMIIGWSYSRPSRLGGHPEPGLWQTGVTARLLERGLSELGTDLAACHEYGGGAEAAAGIRQPTLVIAGTQDRMVLLQAATDLATAIPGARFETVEAGHMMMLEAPEAIRRLLGDFVASA
jgi:pimeloyl-ACP methyl ester carboxylesterase